MGFPKQCEQLRGALNGDVGQRHRPLHHMERGHLQRRLCQRPGPCVWLNQSWNPFTTRGPVSAVVPHHAGLVKQHPHWHTITNIQHMDCLDISDSEQQQLQRFVSAPVQHMGLHNYADNQQQQLCRVATSAIQHLGIDGHLDHQLVQSDWLPAQHLDDYDGFDHCECGQQLPQRVSPHRLVDYDTAHHSQADQQQVHRDLAGHVEQAVSVEHIQPQQQQAISTGVHHQLLYPPHFLRPQLQFPLSPPSIVVAADERHHAHPVQQFHRLTAGHLEYLDKPRNPVPAVQLPDRAAQQLVGHEQPGHPAPVLQQHREPSASRVEQHEELDRAAPGQQCNYHPPSGLERNDNPADTVHQQPNGGHQDCNTPRGVGGHDRPADSVHAVQPDRHPAGRLVGHDLTADAPCLFQLHCLSIASGMVQHAVPGHAVPVLEQHHISPAGVVAHDRPNDPLPLQQQPHEPSGA
mmetsp:Transcript_9657/g.27625  ORF Transcript_9657/g.27625 Transcript_9657/m.27625 type:complete len:462 (+) Transcript_9657:359-1744(+)